MVRAEGRIKAAMFIISVGSILNICLDPIFIKVLSMGTEGAGIATVLSMAITTVITLIYFLSSSSGLSFDKKSFSFKSHLMKDITSVGISGMAMQPIIGMNFGAKNSARVKEAFNKFLLATTAIALVIWAVFIAIPEKILSLYITDPLIVVVASILFIRELRSVRATEPEK